MSVRVGIIGYGYMGRFHIEKCNAVGDLDIVAVYDISPEKCDDVKEQYPENVIKTHETFKSFLDDDEIDMAIICTPNNSHKELSIACLKAGKHVVCEKPVTMDLAELDEILAVADEVGKVFTVHQNRRWDSDYLVVKELVNSGEIGKVTNLVSCVHGQRGVCFGWRGDPEAGGGMLYDWGIHLIDQVLQLFPEDKVVSVYCRLLSVLTPAVDDWFELKLVFDSNVCATILVTTFALEDRARWFVYGDKGTLKLDDFTGEKGGAARIREDVYGFDSVFSKAPMGPSRTMSPLQPEFIEQLQLPKVVSEPLEFHRNLAATVKGQEKQHITYDDMRRAMAIVDAAFASAKANAVINLEV